MQGWTATVRHGVTKKKITKKDEKELENLFLKSPHPSERVLPHSSEKKRSVHQI